MLAVLLALPLGGCNLFPMKSASTSGTNQCSSASSKGMVRANGSAQATAEAGALITGRGDTLDAAMGAACLTYLQTASVNDCSSLTFVEGQEMTLSANVQDEVSTEVQDSEMGPVTIQTKKVYAADEVPGDRYYYVKVQGN